MLAAPLAASARTITVRAGQSIQAAVDAAAPGDTVRVLSGDYHEAHAGSAAVHITKSLSLVAGGRVRILPYGEQTSGIVAMGTAEADIDGLVIRGFTVEGFPNNGIWLAHVNHFNIENNVSINNEENGIWPTLSANGQVRRNVSYGSKDSALWVEASENVRVLNNDLHHSPTGLEITISKNLTIANNNVHNNTVGIGLYHPAAAGLTSPWPSEELGNWYLVNNYVHDNNEPNTATGGEVALLPPGLGILVLGVDRVDLQANRIERNGFVGIGMLDWCIALGDPGCFSNPVPEGFEDTALDYTQVVDNRFVDNHTGSPGGPFGELASDIMYVGADAFSEFLPPGTYNCVANNTLIERPRTHRRPDALVIALPVPLPSCDE
jgi:parallel beta-helix repeat protein